MNTKPEENKTANENQQHDAGAIQDLTIQTLNEADADYAQEIKGGKKANLTVRKAGGEQQE